MIFIMIVCAVVWSLVGVVLVAALLRRRPARAQPLALDAGVQRRMELVVASSVAGTIIVISIFTLASYLVTRTVAAPKTDELKIALRGYQWWWQITYPIAGSDQTFHTANEIHVPLGRPVRISLSADDVIHSFWVPSLAGKQDLIPGRDNEITFTAIREGIYRGQCAEFCGLAHARMALIVIAEPAAQFEAWRQSQLASGASPADSEQEAGREVFVSKACSACHAIEGTTAGGTLGPDLTHVASRRYIAAGMLETTRGSLAAWIADPQTIKPGNNMPMVSLSADELNAVSAYLAHLK